MSKILQAHLRNIPNAEEFNVPLQNAIEFYSNVHVNRRAANETENNSLYVLNGRNTFNQYWNNSFVYKTAKEGPLDLCETGASQNNTCHELGTMLYDTDNTITEVEKSIDSPTEELTIHLEKQSDVVGNYSARDAREYENVNVDAATQEIKSVESVRT